MTKSMNIALRLIKLINKALYFKEYQETRIHIKKQTFASGLEKKMP